MSERVSTEDMIALLTRYFLLGVIVFKILLFSQTGNYSTSSARFDLFLLVLAISAFVCLFARSWTFQALAHCLIALLSICVVLELSRWMYLSVKPGNLDIITLILLPLNIFTVLLLMLLSWRSIRLVRQLIKTNRDR